jgi:competence protein ComEC
LGILTVMSWRAFFAAPDGLLHLTLLDVAAAGQTGEVFLIQTPTGRFLLVNGGPSASLLSDALGRRLPFYHRKLDVLIIASPLDEQLAALPRTIERYPPANVLWAGSPNASRSSRLLQQTLAAAQIPLLQAQSGQVLDLGSGATLKVLTSGKRGAILLLEWQRFRALLPLGAQFEDLDSLAMGRNVGNLSTLLLADHGYAPLNPSEWIANLHPQVILLSVAAGNRSGLPSPETLQTIAGYPLLRTDQNGWIHLSTDGENLWSEVAKR